MLEYSRQVDETTIELTKAVAPGQNIIDAGEDVAKGRVVVEAGTRLRAQEIGLLAGLGLDRVRVVRRPRVAVISTGNELVEFDRNPPAGCIREINSHSLRALLKDLGAEPVYLGLVPDDPERLTELVGQGIEETDTVLVSGGSSVGAADWTLRSFLSFDEAELLIHGVSISPGKPVILVRAGSKSLWGLPGHVAGAYVAFQLFVRPLILDRLLGQKKAPNRVVEARLARNLSSAQGREDWVRVRLRRDQKGIEAEPVLGPSGLISTLVQADGLVRVPLEAEGLLEGSPVEVHLL
jgi:molybdopterin molybdotransferase